MSSATLKQELTSHQKNPTKNGEKKKNHHRLKVVGVLGEKSDRSHQNTKPQLKPSGGNYLLVGGGFSQTFVGMFTPKLGEDDSPILDEIAYVFQMGYGLVKNHRSRYWIHPPQWGQTQDLEVFACVFREGGSVRSHLVRDPGTSVRAW